MSLVNVSAQDTRDSQDSRGKRPQKFPVGTSAGILWMFGLG